MEVVLKDISFWDSPLGSAASRISAILSPKNSRATGGRGSQLRKLLLDGVSIQFSPGSVTALHGYGGGSSALLSILSAQRQQQYAVGQVSGSILYDQSIRSLGAYCDIACCSKIPFDYLFDLTVYDYLFWAARLRVTVSAAECRFI